MEGNRNRRNKNLSRILLLLGSIVAIIWASPLYLLFVNSFKTQKQIFADKLGLPESLEFSNYIQAAERMNIFSSFINSLVITIVGIIVIIIFSAMAAYALERNKRKMSGVIFLIFAAAVLVPFQTVMIPLVTVFGNIGMLNQVGLIIMYLGFGASSGIFLYHGALKGVPKSLDEAAQIDGCGRFKTFWIIIFPNLKSVTVTIALLDVIWIWNDYLLPKLIIDKKGMETIPLKVFYFFSQFGGDWHLAMAALTLTVIPVLVFYFVAQKQIIKGVMSGAVKQ